jgi:hypothetical protein
MLTSHPVLLQSLEKNIINIDGMALDHDKEAFFVFFDILVPTVVGHKIWTSHQKAARRISESKKVISVLEKAFTILALEITGHAGMKVLPLSGQTQGRVIISTWGGPMRCTHVLINCAPFYKCSIRLR